MERNENPENSYEIIRGLWKGVGFPAIVYGMEVVGSNKVEEEKWERIQDKIGRLGLGANRYVSREAIRGEMGWSTFDD